MLVSLCLFLTSHIFFLSYDGGLAHDWEILIPLVMMGFFYATYAAVFWPCIPLVVEEKVVGTAYGIVNSV